MRNLGKMLQQVQNAKTQMERTQRETRVTFSSNGVEVVANGRFAIESVTLSDELVQSQDRAMIQDLVLVAVNGALAKVREKFEGSVAGLASGLDLSGLF